MSGRRQLFQTILRSFPSFFMFLIVTLTWKYFKLNIHETPCASWRVHADLSFFSESESEKGRSQTHTEIVPEILLSRKVRSTRCQFQVNEFSSVHPCGPFWIHLCVMERATSTLTELWEEAPVLKGSSIGRQQYQELIKRQCSIKTRLSLCHLSLSQHYHYLFHPCETKLMLFQQ